jgi:LacI family transcriptional regulator
MRLVLDHLVATGSRRPGFVTVPPVFAVTADAIDAYAAWCGEARIEPAVAAVDIADLLEDRESTVDAAVGTLLAEGVDAIHCPVEQLGIAALDALDRRGIDVPKTVRLSTTNDAGRAETARVPLTTVDTDHAELGRLSVETLLDILAGHASPPLRLQVGASLSVRDSTAPARSPAGGDLG